MLSQGLMELLLAHFQKSDITELLYLLMGYLYRLSLAVTTPYSCLSRVGFTFKVIAVFTLMGKKL